MEYSEETQHALDWVVRQLRITEQRSALRDKKLMEVIAGLGQRIEELESICHSGPGLSSDTSSDSSPWGSLPSLESPFGRDD